ncbi:MAG: hypothetical protein LBB80_08320 [Treponema sp.]|jgi:hypothetical protein|nr:hypothetical protein [Treponema sp.]
MKITMSIVTDAEIADGYWFHYENCVLITYDTPDDAGHTYGYDTISKKDYDLWFGWTTLGYWVFVKAWNSPDVMDSKLSSVVMC